VAVAAHITTIQVGHPVRNGAKASQTLDTLDRRVGVGAQKLLMMAHAQLLQLLLPLLMMALVRAVGQKLKPHT